MTGALRLPVEKEIRALLPTWLAMAAALVLAGVLDESTSAPSVQFAFALGSVAMAAKAAFALGAIAIGAVSIGHEYTGHTLGLLLTQPAPRRRLFAVKLGVVGLMLLALAAVAWLVHPAFAGLLQGSLQRGAIVVLPALAGLCVAPALTMACRSPMAGVVFTVTLLSSAWGLGGVLAEMQLGREAGVGELEHFRLAFLWWSTIGISLVAAVSSWALFARLEVTDARGPDMGLPQWERCAVDAMSDATPVRRRPVWQLVKKELRLQQMTLIVGALYLPWWGAMAVLWRFAPEAVTSLAGAVAILYGPLLALLSGSLASAEERQLGTIEWQMLLPLPMWKQWAVKTATVAGLALVLGVGLPALLMWINPALGDMRINAWLGFSVVLIAALGLYVSSLSTSGVRALLLSLPVGCAVVLFAAFVGEGVGWAGGLVYSRGISPLRAAPPTDHLALFRTLLSALMWLRPDRLLTLLVIPFIALVLRFALANHRSGERPAGRVWNQALWTAGSLLLVGLVILVVGALTSYTAMRVYPPRAMRARPTAATVPPSAPR